MSILPALVEEVVVVVVAVVVVLVEVVWKGERQMGRTIGGGRRSRPVNVCGDVLTVLRLKALLVVADQGQE